MAELAQPGRIAVHDDGAVVQIHAPRVVDGVPVRDSYLTAVINHGNLVLFGANKWGTVRADTAPTRRRGAGRARAHDLRGCDPPTAYRRRAHLALVPLLGRPARVAGGPRPRPATTGWYGC